MAVLQQVWCGRITDAAVRTETRGNRRGTDVASAPDMAHLMRAITTPFFAVIDFALDAPGPATGLAIGGAAMLAMMLHFVR